MQTQTPASSPPGIFDEVKPAAEAPPAPAPEVKPTEPTPKVEPEAGPGSDGKAHGNEPEKVADQKPPEPEKKEEERIVPEKYDLKLSENSLLQPAAIGRIEAYAKSQGLTQDEAAALVRLQEEDVSSAIADRKTHLYNEAVNDKTIGGEALKENVLLAKRFLDKHGSPELRAEFDRYGHGNHKEIIRMFSKLERQFGNDQAVVSRQHGSAEEKPMHDYFYAPDKT